MTTDEARSRFAAASVARLATTSHDDGPHLVPICFAVEGDMIWSAVDGKPKRVRFMKRLRNIAADARVALLADEYVEDWSRLWWARADGTAEIVDHAPYASALLTERYSQYRDDPPAGPFLRITVTRWSGWAYS